MVNILKRKKKKILFGPFLVIMITFVFVEFYKYKNANNAFWIYRF